MCSESQLADYWVILHTYTLKLCIARAQQGTQTKQLHPCPYRTATWKRGDVGFGWFLAAFFNPFYDILGEGKWTIVSDQS